MLYNTFTKVSVLYNYVILLVKMVRLQCYMKATDLWDKYTELIGIGIAKCCKQQVGKGYADQYIGSKYKANFNASHF